MEERYAKALKDQEVDGRALLTLTKDDLLKEPYKILGGPAANLAQAIEKLKTPIGICLNFFHENPLSLLNL